MSFAKTSAAAAAAAAASSAAPSTSTAYASSPLITIRLYRSLLRASKHFTPPSPHYSVLLSLIHRSGLDDGIPIEQLMPQPPPDPVEVEKVQRDVRQTHLSREQARDLSRSYKELQRLQYERTKQMHRDATTASPTVFTSSSDQAREHDDTEEEEEDQYNELASMTQTTRTAAQSAFEEMFLTRMREKTPPHALLYRRLLREVVSGDIRGSAQMRFPSQISPLEGTEGGGLRQVIRREFRAPLKDDEKNSPLSSCSSSTIALSSKFDEAARVEAAFLALRELNKKLTWARSLGLDLDDDEEKKKRWRKFVENEDEHNSKKRSSTASLSDKQDEEKKKQKKKEKNKSMGNILQMRERNRMQAAREVSPLPLTPPSSYLRPGSYLVAHPLLSGYFARSVIIILDHTDPSTSTEDEQAKNHPGGTTAATAAASSSSITASAGGGTYGLVINKIGLGPTGRDRTLQQVVRADCLPESLRLAFGQSTIREGGPVNFSLQMMHACTPEQEERLHIGGNVLSMIMDDDHDGHEMKKEEEGTKKGKESTRHNSGGDGRGMGLSRGCLGGGTSTAGGAGGRLLSSAFDTDCAVYFQGDIIRAAQAVIDGDMDRDDFSFVVGASCWEVGQLESEIKRGYWFPCRGPPQMALSGMCDNIGGGGGRGSNLWRPKADLWLSMMCALGEDEGTLAHLLLDYEYDENGEACDDF